MASGDQSTRGSYILRTISMLLALILLVFIVWGIFQVFDDSSFWSVVVGIIVFLGVVGLLGWLVPMILRGASTTGMMVSRIILAVVGILILGLIVWGIALLADSSDDNETAGEVDTSTNVVIEDVEQNDSSDSTTNSSDNETSSSESAPRNEGTTSTTRVAQSSEDLPNTGPSPVLLAALSLGALAATASTYSRSRKALMTQQA